jgi:hypothetical protein
MGNKHSEADCDAEKDKHSAHEPCACWTPGIALGLISPLSHAVSTSMQPRKSGSARGGQHVLGSRVMQPGFVDAASTP